MHEAVKARCGRVCPWGAYQSIGSPMEKGNTMAEGFVPSRRQLVLGGAALAAIVPISGSSAASLAAANPLALHDLDQPARMKQLNNFRVLFEMDAAAAPAAGIHKISHPELGQAALYIEPTVAKNG